MVPPSPPTTATTIFIMRVTIVAMKCIVFWVVMPHSSETVLSELHGVNHPEDAVFIATAMRISYPI
jgi:hypothetical protein